MDDPGAEHGAGGKRRPRSAAQRLHGIHEDSYQQSPSPGGGGGGVVVSAVPGEARKGGPGGSKRGSALRPGPRPKSAFNERRHQNADASRVMGGVLRPQSAAYLRQGGLSKVQGKHPLASTEGHSTRFGRLREHGNSGHSGLDLSGLELVEEDLASLGSSVFGSSRLGLGGGLNPMVSDAIPMLFHAVLTLVHAISTPFQVSDVLLPDPTVFISDRPPSGSLAASQRSAQSVSRGGNHGGRPASALSRASSRSSSRGGGSTAPGSRTGDAGPGGELDEPKGIGSGTRARYDLVVCVCGHVGLRKDRVTHMQICPSVAAERGTISRHCNAD